MSIPDYQTIMKPLLQYLNDHSGQNRMQDVIEGMIEHFAISEDERVEMLPSGQQHVIDNRVGWARTYLKKAGLLEDPKRGYVQISEKGKSVVNENPAEINVKFLNRFPEFQEFRKRRNKKVDEIIDENIEDQNDDLSPNELLEKGIGIIHADLGEELLKGTSKN
ncbi:MAG: winged helix-turn-helix domain-containing protein [Spirochaetales bacterium]|uniref:Winged helix-turn-helix domain-containing protein n=1 Tax=Candidatus Thalassospirochaeta sargassi TaxID=3119039 RepID=A0AAJ1IEM4_9SPIO|nr:winged helix-turn-helix domain-containing protein [Spirochaetales bacterium]